MDRAADALNDFAATASFDQVNALCRSFAQEPAGQAELSIESYLHRVGDGAQPTLLRNLLNLDIKRRRAAGDSPNAEEYLRRLPEFADLIRQAFLDSSSLSISTRSIAEHRLDTCDEPSGGQALAAGLCAST